jgi:hypothetical protein
MIALQVAPPAHDAAAMLFDEGPQRDRHLLLNIARPLDRGLRLQKTFVPALLGRPNPANQEAPRRRIVGATAMDSTLLTVVGHP